MRGRPGIAALAALLAAALAGPGVAASLAADCRAGNPASTDLEKAALIDCYRRGMETILDWRDSFRRLNETIAGLRGEVLANSRSPYSCRFDGNDNPPRSAGGSCGDEWNDYASNRHEFLRLYCHVGLSGWDAAVARHKAQADRARSAYESCFDRSIPADIREEYAVTDRATFTRQYKRLADRLKDRDDVAHQYGDLSTSCNALLKELEQTSREFLQNSGVGCAVER